MREAALAGAGHDAIDVVLAGVASELNDVDQRRLIVGLGHCGLLEALRHALRTIEVLEREAHGEADALLNDGALEEDGLAIRRHVAGDDLIGQVAEVARDGVEPLLRVLATGVICDLRHLGEDPTTDLGQICIHALSLKVAPSQWDHEACAIPMAGASRKRPDIRGAWNPQP